MSLGRQEQPLFILSSVKISFVFIESVLALITILFAATSPISLENLEGTSALVFLFVIVFLMFYLSGEGDIKLYEKYMRIERLFRAKQDIPYEKLVLTHVRGFSKRLSTFSSKGFLKAKDSSLKIKPIEIIRNPRNKTLHTDLITWLGSKVGKGSE